MTLTCLVFYDLNTWSLLQTTLAKHYVQQLSLFRFFSIKNNYLTQILKFARCIYFFFQEVVQFIKCNVTRTLVKYEKNKIYITIRRGLRKIVFEHVMLYLIQNQFPLNSRTKLDVGSNPLKYFDVYQSAKP